MTPRKANNFGFTLVELMLGLIVTALVMSALGVLLAAVAQGWKQNEAAQSSSSLTAQAHLRIQRNLKSAHLIGAVRAGSIDNSVAKDAALLIWKNDANMDWRIQFSEVALLEYRRSTEVTDPATIRYYQVNWPASMTPAQKAALDWTLASNDLLYDDANIDYFRNLTYVSYTVLARNVLGCTFNKSDAYTATRPVINYMFQIQEGTTTETDLGSAALRTPTTVPVSQR